jgi:hypothetical protein
MRAIYASRTSTGEISFLPMARLKSTADDATKLMSLIC